VIVENISGGMVLALPSVSHGPRRLHLDGEPAGAGHVHSSALSRSCFRPAAFRAGRAAAKVANALVARNDLPATSVSELIAYARANPGKVTYGSQGAGSTRTSPRASLKAWQHQDVHVPYRGAVPALNDVIAGHIDMFFDTLTTAVPMYRAGKVKILAVGGAERSPVVAEVPTLAESGLPGFRRSPGLPSWRRRRRRPHWPTKSTATLWMA